MAQRDNEHFSAGHKGEIALEGKNTFIVVLCRAFLHALVAFPRA